MKHHAPNLNESFKQNGCQTLNQSGNGEPSQEYKKCRKIAQKRSHIIKIILLWLSSRPLGKFSIGWQKMNTGRKCADMAVLVLYSGALNK